MGRSKRLATASPEKAAEVDQKAVEKAAAVNGSPPKRAARAGARSAASAAAGGNMAAARGKAKATAAPAAAPPELKRATSKLAPWDKLKARFTNTGEVFVVGSGDCGQLGLGPDETSKGRPKKLEYFLDKKIIDVAAGGLHNMALSEDGKLYSWGCNDQKALGRSGEETVPLPVEGLDGVNIVQVVCGDSITAALSDEGNVYAWGTFRNKNGVFGFRPDIDIQPIPYQIPELKRVVSISAGANHIAVQTLDNKLMTWGSGEQGQLGRRILPRSEKESSLIPRIINFKARGHRGGHFEKVFCGAYHTFMLLDSGSLFSFGLNNYGQLGLGDTDEHDGPEEVAELNPEDGVAMVDGGEHHTVILDKKGRIYTCGRNDDGQLGTGSDRTNKPTPHLLKEPTDVWCISSNGAFSLALTKESGNNLWMWGYGEMGQLANNNEDADEPFEVELKERCVYVAAAGGQHTVMLLKPKE
ncbi:Regulator of chromosome condensation [Phlyctochytrium bullatum]|nr:Regulator of chromosome condensation [Phlyctochytrium bullatum]